MTERELWKAINDWLDSLQSDCCYYVFITAREYASELKYAVHIRQPIPYEGDGITDDGPSSPTISDCLRDLIGKPFDLESCQECGASLRICKPFVLGEINFGGYRIFCSEECKRKFEEARQ